MTWPEHAGSAFRPGTPGGHVGTPQQQLIASEVQRIQTPVTVAAKAIAASQALMTGVGFILSVNWGETTGSGGALWYLHDGTDTTGQIVAVLAAPSGAGGSTGTANPGIPFRDGLYLERVSGTLSVCVTYVPLINPLY